MKFFRRFIKHEYPFRFYDSDDSIFTDGCLLSFIVALLKSTRRIESGKWLKSGAETVELAATVGCEMSAKRYAYAFCHKGNKFSQDRRGERPDGGSFIRFHQPDATFEPTKRGGGKSDICNRQNESAF